VARPRGKAARASTRPTWVEISVTRLRQNFRSVRKHVGENVTVCAVVKADAYGHGAVECARVLEAEGAPWLGVTSLDEAVPLRQAGSRARILLMTGFWHGEERDVIRFHLTPTVWEAWHFEELEKAAVSMAVRGYPVHLKVDTGMGRLGVGLDKLARLLACLKSASHLMLEGLSSHLASSEALDAPSIAEQERRFADALRMVRNTGFDPPLIHLAKVAPLSPAGRPGTQWCGQVFPFMVITCRSFAPKEK
jgi:alanine racemase